MIIVKNRICESTVTWDEFYQKAAAYKMADVSVTSKSTTAFNLAINNAKVKVLGQVVTFSVFSGSGGVVFQFSVNDILPKNISAIKDDLSFRIPMKNGLFFINVYFFKV